MVQNGISHRYVCANASAKWDIALVGGVLTNLDGMAGYELSQRQCCYIVGLLKMSFGHR